MTIVPVCLSILFASLLFLFWAKGFSLQFECLHPFDLSISGVVWSAPTYTVSIAKLSLRFHLQPAWATITGHGCLFKDPDSIVTLRRGIATLWFFPVYHRQTAGPWVTTVLHGFSVRVFTSEKTPAWIQLLRDNMIYTILDGETTRLNSFKARAQFSPLIEADRLPERREHDEIKLYFDISHWHVANVRRRLYTLGDVRVGLSRNWLEDQGAVAICAEGSKWTKMPSLARQNAYAKASKFGQLFQSIYCFPSEIFKIIKDPLCTVDVDVPLCTVTFDYFRLRNAELVKQCAMKVRRDYQSFDSTHPGVLRDFMWDMVLFGIGQALGEED